MTRVGSLLVGLVVCAGCRGTIPEIDVAAAQQPTAPAAEPELPSVAVESEPAPAVTHDPVADADVPLPPELENSEVQTAPAAPRTRPKSTSLAERVDERVSGTWTHEPSGYVFPANAKGWGRVGVDRYDAEGNDVGVGYKTIRGGDVPHVWGDATIYVYPSMLGPSGAEMSLAEQFDGEVGAIRDKQSYSDVRELRRSAADASRAGRPVHVLVAELSFRLHEGRTSTLVGSVIAAFRDPPWHVTYRLTFPLKRRDEYVAAFDELLGALGLPPLGLVTASPK